MRVSEINIGTVRNLSDEDLAVLYNKLQIIYKQIPLENLQLYVRRKILILSREAENRRIRQKENNEMTKFFTRIKNWFTPNKKK